MSVSRWYVRMSLLPVWWWLCRRACLNIGCRMGGSGCVFESLVCDGYNYCGDWSDKKFCLNTKLYCRNDECIERSKVNNGKVDMASGYDEFVCCATQGHKCGCIPDNDNCTSSGKCIPKIWIGDARDDCNTSHSDEPCKAIKVQCENCQVIINGCSTNESKMFLLQNSNKNTTTCHEQPILPSSELINQMDLHFISVWKMSGRDLSMWERTRHRQCSLLRHKGAM